MEAIDPQIRTLMQIQTLKVRSEHDQRVESLIQEGLRLREEEQKSRRSLEETMQKTISYLTQLIQGAQGASSNNLPTWENQLHSSSSRRSPDNNLQLFDKLPERKLGSPANALQLFDEMPERIGNYEDVLDQPLLRRQPSTVVVNQKLTQGASSSNSSRSILSSPVNVLQVFDEMPERMIELPDFSLQGKTEGMVEQLPELKQTHDVQGLKLPIEEKVELANSYLQDNPEIMVEQPFELKQTKSEVTCKDQFGCLQLQREKVSPSITESYTLPCAITHLNTETQSVERFYLPAPSQTALGQTKIDTEELQPKPPYATFKSTITTTQWTQNSPKPNPTFRSPIASTPCAINTPLNSQNLPGTNLLEVVNLKTPNRLHFATNEYVSKTIGPPPYPSYHSLIDSSLLRSATIDPQLAKEKPLVQNVMKLQMEKSNESGKMALTRIWCLDTGQHMYEGGKLVDSLLGFGFNFESCGHVVATVKSYMQSLLIRVNFPEAACNPLHRLQCVFIWKDRDKVSTKVEGIIRMQISTSVLPSMQPFHAIAYPIKPMLALEISCKYAAHCFIIVPRFAVRRYGGSDGLRIGYVSSDFGTHPLSHLMGSKFGMHNRENVGVFCYALNANGGTGLRQFIQSEVEHFADISAMSADMIAKLINEDNIQIPINLNGYTKGARNEVFTMQPASIQVSCMGFPGNTRATYIDYFKNKMVKSWESFLFVEAEQIESSEKRVTVLIAINTPFSTLLQRTWLTLVHPFNEADQISHAPTLLQFIKLPIHDSELILQFTLHELLLVWADGIVNWYALDDSEDFSVFKCNDEADNLYSKDRLKNFLIFHMLEGSLEVLKAVLGFVKVYVIQKCIECGLEYHTQSIIATFFYQVLAANPNGCCVMQRRLEHHKYPNPQHKVMVMNVGGVHMLAQDQFGTYVVQHELEHRKHTQSAITKEFATKIVQMRQHQISFHVVTYLMSGSFPILETKDKVAYLVDTLTLSPTCNNHPACHIKFFQNKPIPKIFILTTTLSHAFHNKLNIIPTKVHIVLELLVAAVGNPGKFQFGWQVLFTAFLHSWGQECSEGEGIVTILSMGFKGS